MIEMASQLPIRRNQTAERSIVDSEREKITEKWHLDMRISRICIENEKSTLIHTWYGAKFLNNFFLSFSPWCMVMRKDRFSFFLFTFVLFVYQRDFFLFFFFFHFFFSAASSIRLYKSYRSAQHFVILNSIGDSFFSFERWEFMWKI